MTTIEMKNTGNGEWVPSGEASELTELTPEKKNAINTLIGLFYRPYSVLMAAINYPMERDKYVKAGVFTREEIDQRIKPHVIKNLERMFIEETVDVAINVANDWMKLGIITNQDKTKLFQLPLVHSIVIAYIKNIITYQKTADRYLSPPIPSELPTYLWGFIANGLISTSEAEELLK